MKKTIVILTIVGIVQATSLMAQDDHRQPGQRRFNFEQFDKNGDGKISRDEFPGPPQFFDRLDANHDGFITQEEMERMRREREGRPMLGETLLQALDTDKDGKVSRQEFAAIVNFFAQLDRDGDSSLTADELTGLAFVRPASGELDVDALFQRFDTDRDGKLSEAELTAAPQFKNPRYFTLLDQDKDGFVTKDELKTFMRQQQSKRSQ
ncbi:MAG: EF-hand domain-containing protein [Acidobacteria bacterium]|nr:EF-hand domain-containing protein [Acidobacteriota bacterium]